MEAHTETRPAIEIFTGPDCGYCRRAKAVLERRNLQFREIDVSAAEGREEMQRRLPRARSIPQIFIGGEHVGGCEDLERLDAGGALAIMMSRRQG
jgi:glutaredoxin 3